MRFTLTTSLTLFSTFILVLLLGPSLAAQAIQAAVPAAEALPAAAASTHELQGSFFVGAFSSLALNWLKSWDRFGLITEHSSKVLKVAVGFVVALAAAAGVHFAFDQQAGTLVITGLTTAGVLTALSEALKQWLMNEVIYRGAVQRGARF